jgi:hypothetical protein
MASVHIKMAIKINFSRKEHNKHQVYVMLWWEWISVPYLHYIFYEEQK